VSSSYITYVPHPDTKSEAELSALAAVYKFVMDCHAMKNPAASPSERGKHDGTTKEASADESIVRD
jgi:hypothetical protein